MFLSDQRRGRLSLARSWWFTQTIQTCPAQLDNNPPRPATPNCTCSQTVEGGGVGGRSCGGGIPTIIFIFKSTSFLKSKIRKGESCNTQ